MYNYVYMRTNVVLPSDLIAEIDRLAGARKRSEFLEEAAREKIAKVNFDKTFEAVKGIFKDYPEFATRAKVRRYIRKFRKENSFRY